MLFARAYDELEQHDLYLTSLNIALEAYRIVDDKASEAHVTYQIGEFHLDTLNASDTAKSFFQQALDLYLELDETDQEIITQIEKLKSLIQSGELTGENHPEIRAAKEELLEYQRNSRHEEAAWALKKIASGYQRLEEYEEAIKYGEQALEIFRAIDHIGGEHLTLRQLAWLYGEHLNQPVIARDYYLLAIKIIQEINEPSLLRDSVESLRDNQSLPLEKQMVGIETNNYFYTCHKERCNLFPPSTIVYVGPLQFSMMIEEYKDQLHLISLVNEIDVYTKADSLAFHYEWAASIHSNSGDYDSALSYFQKAFETYFDLKDWSNAFRIIIMIGNGYLNIFKDIDQALNAYHKALRSIEYEYFYDPKVLGLTENGYFDDSQSYFQLPYLENNPLLDKISETYFRRSQESRNPTIAHSDKLLSTGYQQLKSGQQESAVDYFKEALRLRQQSTLTDQNSLEENIHIQQQLAFIYLAERDNYNASIFLLQAATGYQFIGATEEAAALYNALGWIYLEVKQYESSLAAFLQALEIYKEAKELNQQATILASIGSLFEQQGKPELAVVFYKQFVNLSESLRSDLSALPFVRRQNYEYIQSSELYRHLADLLLQQNRVLEAQRVLDLLKVQELDDYLGDVRGNTQTQTGINLANIEQKIDNRAVAVGQSLLALNSVDFSELPPTAQVSLRDYRAELIDEQKTIIQEFEDFIDSSDIQDLVNQLSEATSEQDILTQLDRFINLQNNLESIGQNTVLIYPLILKDRLELILVTPSSEPARYSVSVDRDELNAAIIEFREALNNPYSDPKAIAQKLYSWLIAPMANDLEAVGAETLIYAPDGALRYIPLAALHDGNQWIAERFQVNHITAVSLDDLNIQPQRADPSVLTAVFSEGSEEVTISDHIFTFHGLPFAGQEVENIASLFPNTTQLANETFRLSAVETEMYNKNIIHLATHATFLPGSSKDSFILLGDGRSYVTLDHIQSQWKGLLNNVDLFVLSACETGLGGPELGNGEEILGFGYLMQEAGAAASIASLWQVSDGGTQALMNAFYTALRNGHTKVKALQLAQQALIANDLSLVGDTRSAGIAIVSSQTGEEATPASSLNHPYYWAPFILIGNGL